jgi:CBS domain-containing protein
MFSIYGVSGPMFKGAMEELQRVSHTLGLARTQRIDPVTRHLDDLAAAPFFHPPQAPLRGAGHARSQQAQNEYARLQQPEAPPRHPLRQVSDVMTRRVITVRDSASIQDGWQTLLTQKVGQAPVLDAQGKLVGLLTRAELLSLDRLPSPDQAALVWRMLLSQPLSQVMITPVAGVAPETDLRRAARVLLDTEWPGLPVVDSADRMLGFVSRSDILKAVVHDPPLDLWS